jgi:hypothetical protein
MTKSASKHITSLPEQKADSRAIASLPDGLPEQFPVSSPSPASVPLGYRIALWVWVAGFVLLALQLISEPIQRLLQWVGLFR